MRVLPISGSPLLSPGAQLRGSYETLVAKFIWGLRTRPEIGFNVSCLCKYMSKPTSQHAEDLRKLCRYLAGTMNLGLNPYHRSDSSRSKRRQVIAIRNVTRSRASSSSIRSKLESSSPTKKCASLDRVQRHKRIQDE